MKIKSISVGNNMKIGMGYSSVGCSHSISMDIEDGDDINEVFELASSLVKKKTNDSILEDVEKLRALQKPV